MISVAWGLVVIVLVWTLAMWRAPLMAWTTAVGVGLALVFGIGYLSHPLALMSWSLFFVVALSLVSMLGGTIGGFEINVLILLGGYVIIPLLNILFLVFLEATQPTM